jgi:hypothetical protein
MVATTGFGFFSDFAVIHRWAGLIWQGQYSGQYPYPLMVLLAPIALVPVDAAAAVWLALMILALVLSLKRDALYWIFFVPLLQTLFLGQLDVFFWLVYRSQRPAVWALLSLKPQFLLPALPRIFASKRNLGEFLAASAALHVPFLLIRPSWPAEWMQFLAGWGQNRLTRVPSSTASGSIILSAWIVPFAAALIILFVLRKKNIDHLLFLANPALLPYDYSLLTAGVAKIMIPLSWLALWAAWQVRAGWPYAVLLLALLTLETVREKHSGGVVAPPGRADKKQPQ